MLLVESRSYDCGIAPCFREEGIVIPSAVSESHQRIVECNHGNCGEVHLFGKYRRISPTLKNSVRSLEVEPETEDAKVGGLKHRAKTPTPTRRKRIVRQQDSKSIPHETKKAADGNPSAACIYLERVTGLEPANESLGSFCLTTWPHPHESVR